MSQTPNELVQSVCEVTGTNEAEAKHLLAACNNDVEAAVALFFEGGGVATATEDAEANLPIIDDDDGVRAPIAPIREQLIGPEDDNFYAAAPPPSRLARSVSRRVKVCPLRDFAREGALMEEQLQAAGDYVALDNLYETASNSRGGSSRRNRAADLVAAAQMSEPKKSRLEDLYRPPTDISYSGSFQAARSRAEALKQWLLVNVQSDSFDSQLLNRDVWTDKTLRKLMKRQFLLWQVDSDSSEGRRFVAFYHCAKLPYLCVIDPRTGEEIWKSLNPKQSNILNDLQQFLIDHKDFSQELEDDMGPSTSTKRSAAAICLDSDGEEGGGGVGKFNIEDDDGNSNASSSSQTQKANPKKRNKIMELSEEEQIALAIRNSIQENGGVHGKRGAGKLNGLASTSAKAAAAIAEVDDDDIDADAVSDFGSVEEFQEDDIKSACERTSYEQLLGSNKDELTMVKLRLINAEGADEVVQLRWPSNTKLEVLRSYITQCHSHIPKCGYKLICAFPRKTLESENDASTLKEFGLHPSANLHITLDD